MRINNNLMAMNTHRQLGLTNAAGSKAMEKLSSGYRINRAGDDAAGLAISEKMRAQVRGLNQASRNAQDGISMIQTAEGALTETHAILQRMRELATQSANDTNVGVDRGEIQKEINQLTSEINRIGNTTEFNTQKILKGSDATSSGVNLANTGLTIPTALSGGELVSANLVVTASTIASAGTGTDTLSFNINGKSITVSVTSTNGNTSTGISNVTSNSVAIGFDTVNGITATAMAAKVASALKEVVAAAGLGDEFTINYAANASGFTASTTGKGATNFAAVSANGTSVISAASEHAVGQDIKASAQINLSGITTASGVTDLLGKGFTIGDKTVEFVILASGATYSGSADFSVNLRDVLSAGANFGTNTVAAIANQLGSKIDGFTFVQPNADSNLLNINAATAGTAGNDLKLADGANLTQTQAQPFRATFQVGANQGQSMTVDFNDMRSGALFVAGKAGEAHNVVSGAVFTSGNTVTNGTNNTTVEAALDVSSFENATAAITVINKAIENVSAERSKLGAFQNRLEHTIKNLDTSSENLQASESRIRDVDMAKEMMNFSKNNILQQAAQAMLAQANQAPQGVLQLLR